MVAGQPRYEKPRHHEDTQLRADRWKSWPAVAALVVGLALLLGRPEAGDGFGALSAIVLALVWAAVWSVAAFGAGRPVVRWLAHGEERDWVDGVLASIAGGAVLVGIAFLLSLVGWFRPWPLLIAVLLCAVTGLMSLIRDPIEGLAVERCQLPLIGLAGVALMVAATVSPFYDQWHQHLGFTWIWLNDGSVHALPRNWYSYMPVNSSLLFGYGLGTLGAWSAQVVHWWSGVVTVLAAAGLAQRVGPRFASTWAVWILATSPTMLHLATTAGSDLVITMFTAGAWLGLLRSTEQTDRSRHWWGFAGACVGMAVGTKYNAIGMVAIPAVVGAIVLHEPWRQRDKLREMAAGAGIATLTALAAFAPWGIRNVIATGNPLFPFVNGPFRSILQVPWETAERFSNWLSRFDLSTEYLVGGLDLGTFTRSDDGFPSIGIAFLGLAAVAVLSWRRLSRPAVPALVAATLSGSAFWVASMHANRYMVPVLVLAAVVLGAAVATTLASTAGAVRSALIALIGLAFAWNLGVSVSGLGVERLGCSFGVNRLEALLERLVSSSPAFEEVALLPEGSKVLLVAESRALGFERPVELEHPFGEPRLEELARLKSEVREIAGQLADEGLTHVFANSWEARRIAAINGRQRYFEPADPSTAERLDRFCRECLEHVWSDRGVGLFRIDTSCTAAAPGAGDLASW
jgi:4-amino-4-deoxy-L-arabinose transferase-like glycosyltransferase